MRNLIRHTALCLVAASSLFTATASEPATPLRTASMTMLERELDRQIDRLVTYPLLQGNNRMDGDVLVSFVIDAEGKVNVTSAQSTNPELQAYVLRRLAKIDIGSNPEGTWKTTYMRFKFRPEV